MSNFKNLIFNQHDVVCNQKYAGLPYSTHLKFVAAQGEKFIHLIKDKTIENNDNFRSKTVSVKNIVRLALLAHDSIEDARMTYNDLLEAVNSEKLGNYKAAEMVADIVYCVTDEKGRNRKERKNGKYYTELKENKLAVFVKLSDIAANMLFSKLSGSSMYDKYKSEWTKFKELMFVHEYEEFFQYIDRI